MNLKIISRRLTQLGLGVEGKTLFLDEMPSECERGILLRTPLIGIPFDPELPGYHRGGFQVIVRDKSHAPGAELAQTLFEALNLTSVELVGVDGAKMLVNHLHPKTLPIKYRRSDGNGIEWSINFEGSYVMREP